MIVIPNIETLHSTVWVLWTLLDPLGLSSELRYQVSPLYVASQFGHEDVVRFLVTRKRVFGLGDCQGLIQGGNSTE